MVAPEPAPDRPAAPEPVRAPERRAVSANEAPQAAPKEAADQLPTEAADQLPTEAADQLPTVVGTYSSGGNTYVMYSDGSIQAQTPTGFYRFDTLDELKAFIAAGGESVPPAR